MSRRDFTLLEDAAQPMIAVGHDGSLLFANSLASDLLGYPAEALVGMKVESLMPERFRSGHVALRARYLRRPEVRRMAGGVEFAVLTGDGSEVPVEIGLGPHEDGDCTLVTIRDIRVKHALLRHMEEHEARFRAILASSVDLIAEGDLQTGDVTWHGDVDAVLGYEPGEFPRTLDGWAERIHPEDAERLSAVMDGVNRGEPFRASYRMRCKDGSYRHWEGRGEVSTWVDGKPKTLSGSVTDFTDRVMRERALRDAMQEAEEQAQLNQLILSSFPSHIALLNRVGEIVAVNKAWSDFAERNGGDREGTLGVGANYLEVCAAAREQSDDARAAYDGISAVLGRSRDLFTMEYPCHGPDGERWFWMSVNPSRGEEGGAVMVHVDATERILARTELERTLQEVARLKEQLEGEGQYLREEIKSGHNFEEIVGQSNAMMSMLETVSQVADTDATVLLLGETGTGKEVVARAVHSRSRRRDRALIKVDCASIPSGLVESELFGHMKGSFTGAHESRPGRFELADKGTIFLDEIGELSPDLQAKLLRVLQEGEIQRIGSRDVKSVDVRVIAATNRDLQREVEEGRFRADLYYRLNVFPIQLPPLRHRREDIPLLTAYFISKCATQIGKSVDRVSAQTQQALNDYDWPGNVRELRNVVERAVILSKDGVLSLAGALGEVLPPEPAPAVKSLKRDLEEIERQNIISALEQSGWKIKGSDNAASRLGLSPSTLRSRMKRLGIERRA